MAADNPFLRRFLASVPTEVAPTFTQAQLAAVQRAFGMRFTVNHMVDLCRSICLPWGRFYLVLLFGKERTPRS